MAEDLSDLIRQHLLIDEKGLFEDLLRRSAKYIQLDAQGRVHFRQRDLLRGADAVGLVLLGKRLAKDAKLTQDDAVGIEEILAATGIKKTVAFARLKELKDQGKLESPDRGKYRIVMARAPSILQDLEDAGD